jgi:hypothetical protein
MKPVPCSQCGGEMRKGSKGESNMAVQFLGVIVFIVGLTFSFTGVGAIVGIPLMLAAMFMGYKKKKVMKCGNCGYFFETA